MMTKREKMIFDLKLNLIKRFKGEEIERTEDIISLYDMIKILQEYNNQFPILFNDIKKDINKINLKSNIINMSSNKIPKLNAITVENGPFNNVYLTFLLNCEYNLLIKINNDEIKQIYYDNSLNNVEFNNYLETPNEISNFYKKNKNIINKYINEVVQLKKLKPNVIFNFSSDREICPNQTFTYQDDLISCDINMDDIDNISIKANLSNLLQQTLTSENQLKLINLINQHNISILKRTPINIKDIPSEIRSYIEEPKLEKNKTLTMHKNSFD